MSPTTNRSPLSIYSIPATSRPNLYYLYYQSTLHLPSRPISLESPFPILLTIFHFIFRFFLDWSYIGPDFSLSLASSMSTATITATSNLTTATGCNNAINGIREASFASYLIEDQISAMKARHSCEDFFSPRYSTHEQLTYRVSLGSKRSNYQEYFGELGVFEADKYFKGELDAEKKLNRSKSTNVIKMSSPNASVLSLCPDANRAKTQQPYNWKRFLLALACSCTGKNSLDFDETAIEYKSSSRNCRRMVDLRALDFGEMMVKRPSNIDQCLTGGGTTPIRCKQEEASNTVNLRSDNLNLPVYNSFTRGPSTVVALLQNEEKPRISIEVFGSPPIGKIDMDPSKHRRLLMSCKEFSRNANIDDDGASDSSSDLFEIQTLSRQSSFMSQKPNDSDTICRIKA